MSKITRLVTLSFAAFFIVSPLIGSASTVHAATTNTLPESSIAVSELQLVEAHDQTQKEFLAMQDDITNHLEVKQGKYVYDIHEIKNIVYSFNFAKLTEKNWLKLYC